MTRTLAALAVAVSCSSLTAASGPARPAARTTLDRIYTTRQAERGKQVYQRACVQCHTLDVYRGDMMKPWQGGSLFDLYEIIANLMPQENPGSLKPREYAELVAYILSLNGMPAGSEELPAQPSELKAIRIEWRSKP